jgi:peptidyl-prolyl cis-trans isomerase SurA
MTLKKVVILFRILAVWFLIMLNFNIAYADFNLPNIIIINQNHITHSEINQRWQFFFNNSKIINQKNIKNITIWQEKLLEKLIEESLILENAQKLKLEVSPDELNDYLVQIAGKQQKTLIQWQNFLQKNNLDFSYYVKQVKAEILWLKIIEQKIKPKIQISNLEINEIAEQDNSNVLEPHFLIAEIVINNNNKNTEKFIYNMYQQLLMGTNFNILVNQFSISESAKNNGLIGWFTKQDLNKKVYQAIANLSINGYSLPVQIENNWYIFKVINKKHQNNLDENTKNKLEHLIFQQKLNNFSKSYLQDLKNHSVIEMVL